MLAKRPMDQIFDHWNKVTSPLFDDCICLFEQMFDTVQSGFPPYDIERDANGVTIISVALAGLKREDIEVSVEKDVLHIKHDKTATTSNVESEDGAEILAKQDNALATIFHRGIARRSFDLKYRLTPGTEVTGATMEDGMLRVLLKKETPKIDVKKIIIQ